MTVKLKTEEPFLGRIFAQAKGKECEARGTARQQNKTLIYAPDIFAYFFYFLPPWSEVFVQKLNVSSTVVGREFFSSALLSDFSLVNSFTSGVLLMVLSSEWGKTQERNALLVIR
jgi:hypothetical protein